MSSKHKSLKKGSSNNKEDVCISLVGPVGCGKSALLVKYFTKRFIGEYDPYYEGCWTKHENLDNIEFNVQIMDTYDKEKKNLEKYLKWSDALVLVYSIISKESFQVIQEYLEQIGDILKRYEESGEKKFIKIVLLGNKIDLERYRQVSKAEVESLLRKYSLSTTTLIQSNESKTNHKLFDSTNTLTSENINSPKLVDTGIAAYNLNLTYVETTSCEEYEIVQDFVNKLLRDVKRERDQFTQTTTTNNSSTIQSIDENSTTMSSKASKSTKLINSKRPKSPKSSLFNVIQAEATNSININTNSSSCANTTSAISASPAQSSLNSQSISNESFSSLITNNSPTTDAVEPLMMMTSIAASSNTVSPIPKKNSSKFPFLTKILNKS